MFSRYIGILTILSTFHLSFGQGLALADKNFENHEFVIAKNLYNEHLAKGSIDQERAEKLGYCYYITSDVKGLRFIDSLINKNENTDFLWFWKASLERDKGEYEKAVKSFETFQKLNQTLDVSVQIASCKMIPQWTEIPRAKVESIDLNDKYANSVKFSDNKQFYFYENGIDSVGVSIGRASLSPMFSEVVLMKPYVSVNSKIIEIQIPGMENYIINSFVKLENSNEVIFDGLDLSSEKMSSSIYSGKVSEDWVVTDTKMIKGLKLTDVTSIGQPTLTADGSTLIFAGITNSKSHLYRALRTDGTYGSVEVLKALNTKENECYPIIVGDTLLTFSSDGKIGYGGLDIYAVHMNKLTDSSKVIHFNSPINSTMDDFNFSWLTDSTAKFVSNRDNGKGDDDIWQLHISPEKKIAPPISDGFEEWLEKWQLYKVYFGFDSTITSINPELYEGLEKYGEKYNLELKLTGQTDSRGSEDYNQKLGLNRAIFVKEQINSKINSTEKIDIYSIGENGIINNCINGVECSDNEHFKNRFVELVITPKNTTK